ncbi:uncharacterized protein EV422DRAFT_567464 [Fimicolochytrium jonesii]|uniref:uncharacterized protein n=1 Tax=Fimicolochytrium jonesii TaxID=1396493 RepID=UPI0022FE6670|nr:uncharacterized protein EV422DRAFT_567464 [Fimicolochytrium jonesii]KAI8821136.1 hypothetical protein EV422DRAFT_567464 [Fimicolochytrium jonesii]
MFAIPVPSDEAMINPPTTILSALRRQPLSTLTPLMDAVDLFPSFMSSDAMFPTLLDTVDPRIIQPCMQDMDGTLSGVNGLVDPYLLANVTQSLANADTSYLQTWPRTIRSQEEGNQHQVEHPRNIGSSSIDVVAPGPALQSLMMDSPGGPSIPHPSVHNVQSPQFPTDSFANASSQYPTPNAIPTLVKHRSQSQGYIDPGNSSPHLPPPTPVDKLRPQVTFATRVQGSPDPLMSNVVSKKEHPPKVHTGAQFPLSGPKTPEPSAPAKARSFLGVEIVSSGRKVPASLIMAQNNGLPEIVSPALSQNPSTASNAETPSAMIKARQRSTTNDPAAIVKRMEKLIDSILAEEQNRADQTAQSAEPDVDAAGKHLDDDGTLSSSALTSLQQSFRKVEKAGCVALLTEKVEPLSLKRLMKLLESRIKDLEFVDAGVRTKESTRTPKKKRKSMGPADRHAAENPEDSEVPQVDQDNDDESLFVSNLTSFLHRVNCSLDACRVAFMFYGLLVEHGVPMHQLAELGYSEDMILSGVNLLKTQLVETIYAITEASADVGDNASSQAKALQAAFDHSRLKSVLSPLIVKIYDIMGSICVLLTNNALGDDIVIPLAFVALSPFFVPGIQAAGSSSSASLGLDKIEMRGIDICRTIFSNHANHRTFILDELCANLIKLIPSNNTATSSKRMPRQYRLADGKNSIQMVTALILQLMQSCCSGAALISTAKDAWSKLRTDEQEERVPVATALVEGSSNKKKLKRASDSAADGQVEAETPSKEFPEISRVVLACKQHVDAMSQCAHYVFKFLVSRSTLNTSDAYQGKDNLVKNKRGAISNEAEYKVVLEHIFKDLLVVLKTPEWPGADVALTVLGRVLVQALDDTKKQGDTAIRVLAIEMLGEICAKLRTTREVSPVVTSALLGIKDFVGAEWGKESAPESITAVSYIQNWIADWLEIASSDDPALKHAQLTFLCTWAATVGVDSFAKWPKAVKDTVRKVILHYSGTILQTQVPKEDALDITPMPIALKDLSTPTLDTRPLIESCVELLSARQPLAQSFDAYLLRIGSALDSDVVALRAKALKAMQEVFMADPSVLRVGSVRKVIEARLVDQSPSVRDAAIELVGKFLVNDRGDAIVAEYYPPIAARIMDVGITVRKRTIRLLKDIFVRLHKVENETLRPIKPDILVRLLSRLSDEEDTVKDLAIKSVHEILLSPFAFARESGQLASQAHGDSHPYQAWATLAPSARTEIRERALLLVASLKGSSTETSDAFKKLLDRSLIIPSKAAREDVFNVCKSLVECFMEEILCLEEKESKEPIMEILFVLLQFSEVYPALLASHVKTLQTYLGSSAVSEAAQTAEALVEQRMKQAVIKILENIIPFLEDPDLQNLTAIETDLVQALNRGSTPLVLVAAPCLCSIVEHVTHHTEKLTMLLRRCVEFAQRTRSTVQANQAVPESGWRGTWRSLLLTGQFVRYFPFDAKRASLTGTAAEDLDKLTPGSISTHVCDLLLFFVSPAVNNSTKYAALGTLGDIFITFPRLMLKPECRQVMNSVFVGQALALKMRLLTTFRDYLQHEQKRDLEKKRNAELVGQDGVDIKVLIGNADEMGDAGISSSIMQMYLDRILDCMMCNNDGLTRTAFDLIEIILEQGLVHPLLCMPAIVAMEASPSTDIRGRASRSHHRLYEKHTSFINSKNMDCVKHMYKYLAMINPPNGRESSVQGYLVVKSSLEPSSLPEPYLGRMYALVQAKRPRRNEFLGNMVKQMDVDLSGKITMAHIGLCRFIAENLTLFPYKTQEEVLTVIYHAYRVLSVTGETILREIEKSENGEPSVEVSLSTLAHASVCMGILLVLKTHLQALYTISASRLSVFKPNEGSRASEKPAVRNPQVSFDFTWCRMPFALVTAFENEDEMKDQCIQFQELMHSDYTAGHNLNDPDADDHDGGEIPLNDESFVDKAGQTVITVPDESIPTRGTYTESASSPIPKQPKRRPSTRVSEGAPAAGSNKKRKGADGGSRGASAADSGPPSPTQQPRKRRRKSRANVLSDEDWE